ncbi:MAG: hypothetical protein GY913_00475 [Proteobacteria bacterium]|nr:hypothetical protein [Pseudomonadota bacterium]MCP4915372.1 hypothetical protein [Pseudomonadota bacterium]
MALREVAAGVHVHETPQGFFGLEVGTRMTVLALDQGLLLHSPTNADPTLLEPLGTPRWVLAPNTFHHLYVGPWLDRGLEGWCAPGLPEKRPDLAFTGVVTKAAAPFGDEALLVPLSCFPLTNEVALFHRPSRTLLVTDLVFNFGPDTPWATRAAMWCAGGYPGCRTTFLERFGMKRDQARRDIAALLELDFDRLIPCHGDIVETGGRQTLEAAFHWLDLPA